MLHLVKFLMQLVSLALARDILTAFEQLSGQLQFLTVLAFEFIERHNQVYLFLLYRAQTSSMTLIANRDIFQQRLLLHVECGDRCAITNKLLRNRVDAHAYAGGSGIQQIHRFIRKLTSRQITARQGNCGTNRIVGNVHMVMFGVAGFQAPQHQAGSVVIRLIDFYHLEAAFQGCIALKVLFVFRPGGGRNCPQFTTRQRGLQQVGCIRATGLVASTDDGMRFVDKQQNGYRGLLYCINDVFQTLFKLPLHTRARLQQAEVKRT